MSEAYDKLKERLKYLHDTCGISWRQMALLEDFRGIPWGTLWDIAHDHEPRSPILRRQLGLPEHQDCGQCWRFNKYINRALPRRNKKWRNMSKRSLLLALTHREVMKEG